MTISNTWPKGWTVQVVGGKDPWHWSTEIARLGCGVYHPVLTVKTQLVVNGEEWPVVQEIAGKAWGNPSDDVIPLTWRSWPHLSSRPGGWQPPRTTLPGLLLPNLLWLIHMPIFTSPDHFWLSESVQIDSSGCILTLSTHILSTCMKWSSHWFFCKMTKLPKWQATSVGSFKLFIFYLSCLLRYVSKGKRVPTQISRIYGGEIY